MTLFPIPCPYCDGSGCDVEPECCGNTLGGECRGDCAVPRQVPCGGCGGSGELSAEWDDPVEVELSSPPAPDALAYEEEPEWVGKAKSKLDPYEQAGVDE